VLNKLLSGYHDKDYIVSGFTLGFPLNFDGIHCSTRCSNNHSTKIFHYAVTDKIDSELSVGRFAGPFLSPPFEHFKVSPPVNNSEERLFKIQTPS